jgi:hypothetical protein
MPSASGVYSLPGAIEQPKDAPAIIVPFVDEHGNQIVDGRGNLIVSSRSTLVDSSPAVGHDHIERTK